MIIDKKGYIQNFGGKNKTYIINKDNFVIPIKTGFSRLKVQFFFSAVSAGDKRFYTKGKFL